MQSAKALCGVRFGFKDKTAPNWVKSARWKTKGRRAQVLRLLQVGTGDKSPAQVPSGPIPGFLVQHSRWLLWCFQAQSLINYQQKLKGEKLNPVSSAITFPGRKNTWANTASPACSESPTAFPGHKTFPEGQLDLAQVSKATGESRSPTLWPLPNKSSHVFPKNVLPRMRCAFPQCLSPPNPNSTAISRSLLNPLQQMREGGGKKNKTKQKGMPRET